jgi:hypothetical protein
MGKRSFTAKQHKAGTHIVALIVQARKKHGKDRKLVAKAVKGAYRVNFWDQFIPGMVEFIKSIIPMLVAIVMEYLDSLLPEPEDPTPAETFQASVLDALVAQAEKVDKL